MSWSQTSPVLVAEAAEDVHRVMRDIPDRQIIDFLVQFFVREISWMDQVVHVPWLMSKYQDWCNTLSAEECRAADANDVPRQIRVMDVDFGVLLLRIVSYALQFLPSPIYPLDRIRGVLLADVRNECDDIANTLEAMSWALDGRGSLIRVHQVAFAALKSQTEGNIKACWEAVSRAIRIAQSIGIHSDSVTAIGANETEKEMARRIFCNLYTWDSLLSRQLDRMHALPGRLHPRNWPQLHALPEYRDKGEQTPPTMPLNRGLEAPDPFTERLLQARLADFWRSVSPLQGNEDDIMAAEERYDKFSREFLSQLPPAFALADADESWDRLLPKLPLQRQMLHMAIYDSLCWNFRPLLFWHPSSSLSLPPYKVLLLRYQKRAVAGAALRSLEAVARLHALLGGYHTRLPGIVMSTFEAAVLLLQLCADPSFLEDDSCLNMHQQQQQQHITPRLDPMRANAHMVNRPACMEAVEGAVKRLKMLAEVSSLADIGASTLVELLRRTTTSQEKSGTEVLRNNQLPLETNVSRSKTLTETVNDTIHVATQDHAGLQVPQGQGQEVESAESLHNTPRTTTSSLAGETVVDEATMVTGWNAASAESVDVSLSMDIPSSLQDFMSTITVGDMATWSAFDESSIFPPESDECELDGEPVYHCKFRTEGRHPRLTNRKDCLASRLHSGLGNVELGGTKWNS
ncbi:hypothetical protein NEUTE2DRAFT_126973 [Neurospora tetrasperma FGSC 2509]|nr:hypothetical protein NEUTE2DRAFT_126973 [Neurospora tetrasperma FGSC 2509]